MESFELVSASRVTLAVGSLCLRKRATLGTGDKTCPCKQFASDSRGNFSDSMCNKTKTEHFSMLNIFVILSHKLVIKLFPVVGYPWYPTIPGIPG